MKVNIEIKPKYNVGTVYKTSTGVKRTVIDIIYKVREVRSLQTYSYLVEMELPFTTTRAFLEIREKEIDNAKKMNRLVKEIKYNK